MLEAKTQLSKLVEAALRGEEVIIANRGKPMVRLVPAEPVKPRRQLGLWAGLITEAEVDAAFTPQADAEAGADLWSNLARRDLRVMGTPARHAVQTQVPAVTAPAMNRVRLKRVKPVK